METYVNVKIINSYLIFVIEYNHDYYKFIYLLHLSLEKHPIFYWAFPYLLFLFIFCMFKIYNNNNL